MDASADPEVDEDGATSGADDDVEADHEPDAESDSTARSGGFGPVRLWRAGLERWWRRMRVHATPEERRRVLAILFPHTTGEPWRSKFIVLQAAAVVIATMGLLANSAAVVIGAMLVAPLMRPVLAVAAAVVLGWWRHLGRSMVTVLLAVVCSVLLARILAAVVPEASLTPEVLSRTSPDARDLLVAMAAGIAGAYATIREDVSGALPGVAVAVALVPPLASAGVAFDAGRSDLAGGALLLCAANLVAIATSGAAVFLIAGLLPAPHLHLSFRSVVVGGVVGVAAIGLIAVPLFSATVSAASHARTTARVNQEVNRWIGELDLEVDDIGFDAEAMEDGVVVELSGTSPPPPAALLEETLGSIYGALVPVQVRWTQTARGAPVEPEPFDGLIDPTAVDEAVALWLDGLDLEVDEIEARRGEGVLLAVTVIGPEPPPPASVLAGLLSASTGADVDVSVGWIQQVRFTPEAEGTETDLDVARRLAVDWAERRDLLVVELSFDRDAGDRTLTVVVAGSSAPPEASELLDAVIEAFGPDTDLAVSFVPRRAVPNTTTTTTTTTTTPPEVADPEPAPAG